MEAISTQRMFESREGAYLNTIAKVQYHIIQQSIPWPPCVYSVVMRVI